MKKRLLALLCVTILTGNMALPVRAEESRKETETNPVTGQYVEGRVIVRATKDFVEQGQSGTYSFGNSKSGRSYQLPADYAIETLFDVEEIYEKYQEYFSSYYDSSSEEENQGDQFLMIRSEDKTVDEMISELEDVPGISYVEPDYIIKPYDVSEQPVNDYFYNEQWFLQSSSEVTGASDVPYVWKNGATGSKIPES